jgi:hypothetical protein
LEVFNLLKKYLITFLISFATLVVSSTFANAAVTGMCVTDSNGSIVISANGKAGSQTFSWSVGGSSGTEKAPFNYADNFVDTDPTITANGNNTNACQKQPLFYKIKFYKVAMCTSDPYTGNANPDYSSCIDIFSNSSGKEVIIEPDKEVDLLDGNLLLPVGNYKYLTVILSNHLNIKTKQKYVYADGSRAVMYGSGDTGTNSNTDLCYTKAAVTTYTGQTYDAGYNTAHGVTVQSSNNTSSGSRMECTSGDPSTDYDYATEIIDSLGGSGTLVPNLAYSSMLADTGVDVELAATMLKTDNVSVADDVDNALRINAHFRYTNPIVISENTVGFKLNFATTRGVSLDAGQDGSNKIFMTKVGADPFTIEVQTKTRRTRGAWR